MNDKIYEQIYEKTSNDKELQKELEEQLGKKIIFPKKPQIIGKGSYGSIYKVIHITGFKGFGGYKDMIMKIVQYDPDNKYEITRELDHLNKFYSQSRDKSLPNMCDPFCDVYYSTIKHDGKIIEYALFFAKLFGKGWKDLSKFRPKFNSLTDKVKLQIINNLIRELQRLHNLGIIHRDIKPLNIMIDTKTYDIAFIDFGQACSKEDIINNKECNRFEGTPEYIRPFENTTENIKEMSDYENNDGFPYEYLVSNDIWAMALTIMELLFDSFVFYYSCEYAQTPLDCLDVIYYSQECLDKKLEEIMKFLEKNNNNFQLDVLKMLQKNSLYIYNHDHRYLSIKEVSTPSSGNNINIKKFKKDLTVKYLDQDFIFGQYNEVCKVNKNVRDRYTDTIERMLSRSRLSSSGSAPRITPRKSSALQTTSVIQESGDDNMVIRGGDGSDYESGDDNMVIRGGDGSDYESGDDNMVIRGGDGSDYESGDGSDYESGSDDSVINLNDKKYSDSAQYIKRISNK